MNDYFEPRVEALNEDHLYELQQNRLRHQLKRVWERSTFYRSRLSDFNPEDQRIMDFWKQLPFTTKQDLAASAEENPPFGTHLAVRQEELARVHFSSGTTGLPSPMCWTKHDLETWAQLYARALWSQGIRQASVVQVAYSFAWFVGGLGTVAGVERIGGMVIPAGSGDTIRQLETMKRFAATDLVCTPSFASYLAERSQSDKSLTSSLQPIVGLHLGGEPGTALPAIRARLEKDWHAKCYDCYGSLEFQPIAWECAARAGPHLMEDAVLAEVVDPTTKEPVPTGRPGVLVLTHLDREAMPLIRWWTGDIVTLSKEECECGRPFARLLGGVHGRADDMLIIRGVNVFPSAVADVLHNIDSIGEAFVLIMPGDGSHYLDELHLGVEAVAGDFDRGEVAEQVAKAIKTRLSIRATVSILPRGALPRSTHKARRLLRQSDWDKLVTTYSVASERSVMGTS